VLTSAKPETRRNNAVRLEFAPGSLVKTNLSGAAFSGDWLWVAGDEACSIDRLRRRPPVNAPARADDAPLTPEEIDAGETQMFAQLARSD